MSKNIFRTTIFAILFCNWIFVSGKEQIRTSVAKADSLHKEYKFTEAIAMYRDILKFSSDSSMNVYIQNKITECENGINLMEYIVRPVPVSRKEVPANDFYLYFSGLENKGWIPIPNPLVKNEKHRLYNAIYFPKDSRKIIFSSPDESGSWNIYVTEKISDRHWTAPVILSEALNSAGDEIFPMLSRDGKTLYFASNGLAGMGGFDLFMSTWDETAKQWNSPINLGFPYSSTSDDLIYLNTAEGKYSVFASNRDSKNGKIKIYVTKYIATPVKTSLNANESAAELARLDIEKNHDSLSLSHKNNISSKDSSQNKIISNMDDYSASVRKMKSLQQKYRGKLQKLEESKNLYSKSSETDKNSLSGIIANLETEANSIKIGLDSLSDKVQKMEMNFLKNGIIPVIIKQEDNEADIAENTDNAEYSFVKHTLGTIPYMEIEESAPTKNKFDYSFQILEKGQFAEDNTLPDGLVYQIQFSASNRKASVSNLKGLSPVFVRKLPSGKYLHAVGIFNTYDEALSNLNKVRKRGFSQAFVIAYDNRKSISVKKARTLEKTVYAESYQVVLTGYPEGLPATVITTIKGACNKEISKAFVNNGTQYSVGPFKNKSEADYLIKILTELDIKNVSLKTIKL